MVDGFRVFRLDGEVIWIMFKYLVFGMDIGVFRSCFELKGKRC